MLWPAMELCTNFFTPFVRAFLALLAVALESGAGRDSVCKLSYTFCVLIAISKDFMVLSFVAFNLQTCLVWISC